MAIAVERPQLLLALPSASAAAYAAVLRAHFRVVSAADAREVLALAAEQPDVILTDSSFECADATLCRRLKHARETQDIPVVLLVRRRWSENTLAGWEEGADDCLCHPFHVDELLLRLHTTERLGRQRRLVRARRDQLLAAGAAAVAVEDQQSYTAESLVGRVVAGCRLRGQLAHGKDSHTYRAVHLTLQRDVCVKLMPRSLGAWEPARLERFLRGARIAARLEHPNLVPVLHAGREDEFYFVIRPFIIGTPLNEVLDQRSRLPAAEALAIVWDVAAGLEEAHRQGVLHRDIKPANIILDQRATPRVIDFGLARPLGISNTVSSTGEIIGTPHYMAPEQVDGEPLDERADVYSLGATFFHLVTGRPPFEGASALQVLRRQVNEPTPAPEQFAPDLPPGYSEVILKMMAKRREDRYADMDAVLAALADLVQD